MGDQSDRRGAWMHVDHRAAIGNAFEFKISAPVRKGCKPPAKPPGQRAGSPVPCSFAGRELATGFLPMAWNLFAFPRHLDYPLRGPIND
jgi:hypothetical protein